MQYDTPILNFSMLVELYLVEGFLSSGKNFEVRLQGPYKTQAVALLDLSPFGLNVTAKGIKNPGIGLWHLTWFQIWRNCNLVLHNL